MYPVSDAFLRAVQENTRNYCWTGQITTKGGAVYPFVYEDIVKGSGYLTAQCCGSAEIELGTVYAAEMGITLFSQIDRYTLEGAEVRLSYHLRLADGSFEEVPMGIFEVSEANRTAHCLELKAYDYMLRFEKSFNGFETVGNAWAFLDLCCKACNVVLAHTQAEIEAMPNGTELLSIYPENDIETYRDVLYFVGQVLGGFFCINREGKLELRKYGTQPVMEVKSRHRFTSSFSDFITRYTAVSSTNLRTQTAEYYALEPDDGLTMNLAVNPLLQFGLEETRETLCRNILNDLAVVSYVPFDSSTIGNPALDLGDVLTFTGGQADGSQTACITSPKPCSPSGSCCPWPCSPWCSHCWRHRPPGGYPTSRRYGRHLLPASWGRAGCPRPCSGRWGAASHSNLRHPPGSLLSKTRPWGSCPGCRSPPPSPCSPP